MYLRTATPRTPADISLALLDDEIDLVIAGRATGKTTELLQYVFARHAFSLSIVFAHSGEAAEALGRRWNDLFCTPLHPMPLFINGSQHNLESRLRGTSNLIYVDEWNLLPHLNQEIIFATGRFRKAVSS